MQVEILEEAIKWAEKSAANVDPDLFSAKGARDAMELCARGEKMFAYLKTAFARRVADVEETARVNGTLRAGSQASRRDR